MTNKNLIYIDPASYDAIHKIPTKRFIDEIMRKMYRDAVTEDTKYNNDTIIFIKDRWDWFFGKNDHIENVHNYPILGKKAIDTPFALDTFEHDDLVDFKLTDDVKKRLESMEAVNIIKYIIIPASEQYRSYYPDGVAPEWDGVFMKHSATVFPFIRSILRKNLPDFLYDMVYRNFAVLNSDYVNTEDVYVRYFSLKFDNDLIEMMTEQEFINSYIRTTQSAIACQVMCEAETIEMLREAFLYKFPKTHSSHDQLITYFDILSPSVEDRIDLM